MKKNNIVAIVQARMGSTRLPGKTLLLIEGQPELWHVVKRLRQSKLIDTIVLAIPDTKENDVLEQFAKEHTVDYFRGSESNLLERHYLAAKKFGADVIVRIPSDNPLIDPAIVDMIIQRHLDSDADYTSNVLQKTFPTGFHTEVFGFNILEKVFTANTDDYQKEHATPYIYQHPEIFKLQNVEAPEEYKRPQYRVTLDTKEDLAVISAIYKEYYKPGEMFGIGQVIEFLDAHPDIALSNKKPV